jgi:hypothetical protein
MELSKYLAVAFGTSIEVDAGRVFQDVSMIDGGMAAGRHLRRVDMAIRPALRVRGLEGDDVVGYSRGRSDQ